MIKLSTAYFGPIQYFSKFTGQKKIYIEQNDHYIKQTYRNRCVIYSANGPLSLVVPVKRFKGRKTKVKDIKIDYDTNWQKIHLQGIISSYSSSPYFDYLRDDIEPFFSKKYNYLMELNQEITLKMIQLLQMNTTLYFTNDYLSTDGLSEFIDYRDIIHPKKSIETDKTFLPVIYHQVFHAKFGFIPNLSILDLLFNQGNEARLILNACNKEQLN